MEFLYNLSYGALSKAIGKYRPDFIHIVTVTLLQFQQVNEAGFPFTGATLMLPQQNCVDLCSVTSLPLCLFPHPRLFPKDRLAIFPSMEAARLTGLQLPLEPIL